MLRTTRRAKALIKRADGKPVNMPVIDITEASVQMFFSQIPAKRRRNRDGKG
jgi:hypothetical protein